MKSIWLRAGDIFIHDYLGTSWWAPLIGFFVVALIWVFKRNNEVSWKQWRLKLKDAFRSAGLGVGVPTAIVYGIAFFFALHSADKEQAVAKKDEQIRDLRQELTNLSFVPRNAIINKGKEVFPWATAADLVEDIIKNKTVYVPDLPISKMDSRQIPDPLWQVHQKHFENCYLVGPAVIYIRPDTAFEGNKIEVGYGPQDVESRFLLRSQGDYTMGVVPFSHCVIKNCTLVDISFAGSELDLDIIKDSFTNR
jgi:hypothetical protein